MMTRRRERFARLARAAIALAILAGWCSPGYAQMFPPHVPGTICATPYGWCWMAQQVQPGYPCFCPSAYGPVRGTAV
jgi:hypothetical protein